MAIMAVIAVIAEKDITHTPNNMKTTLKIAAALLALAVSVPATTAGAQTMPTREHRGLWLSPMLSSSWPSSPLTTEDMATFQRTYLKKKLSQFKDQNINIIYFHVRPNCDAMYKSSYEPWSRHVAGTRGGTPAEDPFQMVLEEAHAVGIEVYAWLNPYRYSSSTSPYGTGNPLDYENSHPDWLVKNSSYTYLNPGIPEVTQRIVDIVTEIVTNYDVDGVVYDDYFYPSGMGADQDATQYNAYTSAGGSMNLADWRRSNINNMVKAVKKAVKKVKPYVVFGVGPAGVACPPDTESKYGISPVTGDWQYGSIYSDPLSWLNDGDIDFLSPQIYWPSRFDELSKYYSNVAQRFDRHVYPSVTLSEVSTHKTAEFIRETKRARQVYTYDASGMVFFHYGEFVNYTERYNGKRLTFGEILAQDPFREKALTPIRTWEYVWEPKMVSNVTISGTTLKWDAVPGMRYTVYAFPTSVGENAFACQREYLQGIVYTNSYEIPADMADGFNWAVCVYDRYGNEYSAVTVGGKANTGTAATLTFPINGEKAPEIFSFKWNGTASRYRVEVSDKADMGHIIALFDAVGNTASSTRLPHLEDGVTYYWRVRSVGTNMTDAVSAVQSFKGGRIAFTSPSDKATGVSATPTITWTKVDVAEEVSHRMAIIDGTTEAYVYEGPSNSVTVPEGALRTGRTYTAELTTTVGDYVSESEPITFTTANRTDYTAPGFTNPAADGATIHVNEGLAIEKWSGLASVTVYISTSKSFGRTAYSVTLRDFETVTKNLGEIKVGGKALEDGKTYYCKTRAAYYVDNSTKNTADSPVRSFVYSSTEGVNDVVADTEADAYIDNDAVLHTGCGTCNVSVYTLAGAAVHYGTANADGELSLASLPCGMYIVRLADAGSTAIKWVKK